VSIITLSFPDTARGLPFYLKRKPVLQAIRNGAFVRVTRWSVVGRERAAADVPRIVSQFEIPYSPLLPAFASATPAQTAQARRNTLSLARDLIRITRGKGIILSSGGTGGEWGGVRAPGDVVNLGTLMGLSPDQAHDCVVRSPKSVVLRARASSVCDLMRAIPFEPTDDRSTPSTETRKTFKGLMSVPRIVADEGGAASETGAAEDMVVE